MRSELDLGPTLIPLYGPESWTRVATPPRARMAALILRLGLGLAESVRSSQTPGVCCHHLGD